tara:strand:+ start:2022 stop:3098 length:1077 start_codon:yes stop_codon:yes gene_type:complete
MGFMDSVGSALGFGGEMGSTESEPWKEQIPYLKETFKGAQNLYNQGPQQYYGGNTVAGSNPAIQNYLTGMGGHAQGGLDASAMMGGYGSQLAGGLTGSQNFYSDAMNGYTNPYATKAYQDKFNVSNPYESQNYQDIISNSVNNNPVLQAQIESGQQGINRNLSENILPSIASGAVGTGNVGSMRRGVAEGVAARGAMEQGSDMATNMRANAYNQGINQANDWAGGQQFSQTAGMRGAEMGAAGEQYGQNYMMNAANNNSNLSQYGLDQVGQGYNQGTQAYQDLLSSGAYGRGMEQENINADKARFDFEQNAPWDNLGRYNQMIQGNYGGTSTQYGDSGNMFSSALMQLAGAAVAGQGG